MYNRIADVIYAVIDEVNLIMPRDKQLNKTLDTILFSLNEGLDSFGLLNFIVIAEQKLEEEFGMEFCLSDEEIVSVVNTPFKSIQSLTDYLISIIEIKQK